MSRPATRISIQERPAIGDQGIANVPLGVPCFGLRSREILEVSEVLRENIESTDWVAVVDFPQ